MNKAKTAKPRKQQPAEELESVTIRFAGDSGDGIQLTGMQFSIATAMAGNDLSTFPDYPAEVRAPLGSLGGVSGYQIHFSSGRAWTPGDAPDVLVAMNPAALKVNLKDLRKGGQIIANSDAFNVQNLAKAGYTANPLEDGSLSDFRVIPVELTRRTGEALHGLPLTKPQAERCKNFYALGLMYWLYDRPMEGTLRWIEKEFKKNPVMVDANQKALLAGNAFAETTELFGQYYRIKKSPAELGLYRNVTGNEAMALGLLTASHLSGLELWYGSYPITPASEILHELSKYKNLGVKTFQAEDEIAAMCSVVGAAFAGALATTGTSGPGVSLKSEAMGLGVILELPMVIINVQRGGPSTGLPTKTEQSDLWQALYGRHGECPMPVLAAATPAECFATAIEACRIAIKYMTPVLVLSDGFLGIGSEPWRVPDVSRLAKFPPPKLPPPDKFQPYQRDLATLARPWALPGMPGYEHRIGGLEKADVTGAVSYDPDNHERMSALRQAKLEKVSAEVPPAQVHGPKRGKVLVVGWGSTYGAITAAVSHLQAKGEPVASVHLRHLNPLPANLGEVLGSYEHVVVPEMNMGQLVHVLRDRYLVPAVGINKIKGQAFKVAEIESRIREFLSGGRN
ncbi:MAG: 2-oxoacid:acceptor oxidoreductase subunit alpha [Elusimicrobia bacterium]|nr:2-oxoacid:acceptor oxidoreductase subunit alpha [Elusimicrobiota bacterium]